MSRNRSPALRPRWIEVAIPFLLLALHATLAISSLLSDSITFDEPGHLASGLSSWKYRDHRMFPQNGEFPKRWAALGPLLVGVRVPTTDQDAWWQSDVDRFGHELLYESGNQPRKILISSRLLMVALELCLGLTIYCWSRSLFGLPGACVSLALFTFSPTLLAHGRLATSDTAVSLSFLLALLFLWRVLHRITLTRLACSTLSIGLLLISKMSGLLILPLAALLLALRLVWNLPLQVELGSYRRTVRNWRAQLGRLSLAGVAIALGTVLIIWAAYDFQYFAFRESRSEHDQFLLGETIGDLTNTLAVGPAIRLGQDHKLLPEAYLFGLAHVLRHSDAHPAFMNGSYSHRGWWQFHPYSVLVKTPFSVFVIAALAVWASLRAPASTVGVSQLWRRAQFGLYRTAPLWAFLAIYWATALRIHLSIGHRHVLPTYPVVFILCGAAGVWVNGRTMVRGAIVSIALACLALESIWIWPNYSSYFNPLIGGPRNGYKHLVDSSLDWGQDLDRLRVWQENRRRISADLAPVYLSYFGSADPAASGVEAVLLPCYLDWRERIELQTLMPGTYVISATMLQSVYNPAFGPWNERYEQLYWHYAQLVRDSFGRSLPFDGLRHTQDGSSAKLAYDFERLRLARLCATLRQREPDERIGNSLLVFHVSADELEQGTGGN